MWSVEVLGERFSENELTIGQYVKLEDELGVPWRVIHPVNSAKQAAAIMGLLYAERKGLSVEHARSVVNNLGALEFHDSVEMAIKKPWEADDDADDEPEKADPQKAA